MSILYAPALLISASLIAAAPAWAQTDFEQGVEARYAGDTARALQIFNDLLEANPENADIWVQLGFVYLGMDAREQARIAFETALTLAPDYSDAKLGLARLAWYDGEPNRALEILDAAGNTEEVAALRAQILSTPPRATPQRWRTDITFAYRDLSQGLPSWTEANFALGYRLSDTTAITGEIQYARRFNTSNTYVSATLSRGLNNGGELFGLIGGAPDATFRPEAQLILGGVFPLTDTTNDDIQIWGRLIANASRYATGNVESAALGGQLRLLQDRVRIGSTWSVLSDETGNTRTGLAFDAEWQLQSRVRLLAGYSDAPETSDGFTLDVRSMQFGVRIALDQIQLGLTAVREERRAYDTGGIVLSVTRRF